MINIDVLHEHPKNPRKSIGDISELIESIKKNGIMQNLTVIPGHFENDKFVDGDYTILIGHRRYNAAKEAGLKALPCRIVEDVAEIEQLSIMLEENMQRTDLTIWEQANGFQLMLDLGDTEDSLAEKTGFSKQTIRHRLNIAKLDAKELKKKEQDEMFQLSLRDLYELEKIESIEKRNEILKISNNSRDLVWRAHTAAEQEKMDKKAEIIIKALKDCGVKEAPEKVTHEMYSGKWETVKDWDLRDTKDPKLPKSTQADIKSDWLYYRYYGSVKLIKPICKNEEKKKVDPADKNKKEIKAIMKELMQKKHKFINEIILGKLEDIEDKNETCEQIWDWFTSKGVWVSNADLRKFFTGKSDYEVSEEERAAADKKISCMDLLQKMLIELDCAIDNTGDITGWRCCYNKMLGKSYISAFEILKKWGWSFNEDEELIINGTHELFIND